MFFHLTLEGISRVKNLYFDILGCGTLQQCTVRLRFGETLMFFLQYKSCVLKAVTAFKTILYPNEDYIRQMPLIE